MFSPQYDTDGSGEIEFPEFCNMMSNKMSQQDDAEMVKASWMMMMMLMMMMMMMKMTTMMSNEKVMITMTRSSFPRTRKSLSVAAVSEVGPAVSPRSTCCTAGPDSPATSAIDCSLPNIGIPMEGL